MNDPFVLGLAFNIIVGLLVFIFWVLLLWAIIRGAVLSALRKYRAEGKPTQYELYRD